MPPTDNSKRAWGNTADQLLLYLKEFGPSTANEAFADLGLNPGDTRQVMHRLGKPVKRGPTAGQNRIHIKAWVREATGLRDYPRPLWAYGPGVNAKKPTPKAHAEVQKDQRSRTKRKVNSVFQLGGVL